MKSLEIMKKSTIFADNNQKMQSMANKRTLKKAINAISEELFTEAVAASLYGSENNRDNSEALLFTIVKMQSEFTCRVSHPEPGMPAKKYFADLRDKFSAQASDIIDQINSL